MYLENNNKKKVGMARLISNKGDFRTRNITINKEVPCILIKGSLQQEDTIMCVYLATELQIHEAKRTQRRNAHFSR